MGKVGGLEFEFDSPSSLPGFSSLFSFSPLCLAFVIHHPSSTGTYTPALHLAHLPLPGGGRQTACLPPASDLYLPASPLPPSLTSPLFCLCPASMDLEGEKEKGTRHRPPGLFGTELLTAAHALHLTQLTGQSETHLSSPPPSSLSSSSSAKLPTLPFHTTASLRTDRCACSSHAFQAGIQPQQPGVVIREESHLTRITRARNLQCQAWHGGMAAPTTPTAPDRRHCLPPAGAARTSSWAGLGRLLPGRAPHPTPDRAMPATPA